MNFTARRPGSSQLSLLGEHDQVEHAPQLAASRNSQRWTTRAQVEQLLAHPRIRELWPTGEYVAADPCAGTGRLVQHVDAVLGSARPAAWWANELDPLLVPPTSYETTHGRIQWSCGDAARLGRVYSVGVVITNLPWFGVFARLVGRWRTVAFPHAVIVALCDDQERTREPSRKWLADGNMPYLRAEIPGRTQFDPPGDGQYPFSCSWYVWRPGERRSDSTVITLPSLG